MSWNPYPQTEPPLRTTVLICTEQGFKLTARMTVGARRARFWVMGSSAISKKLRPVAWMPIPPLPPELEPNAGKEDRSETAA